MLSHGRTPSDRPLADHVMTLDGEIVERSSIFLRTSRTDLLDEFIEGLSPLSRPYAVPPYRMPDRRAKPVRQLWRSPVVSVGHVRPGRRGGCAPRASMARATSGW